MDSILKYQLDIIISNIRMLFTYASGKDEHDQRRFKAGYSELVEWKTAFAEKYAAYQCSLGQIQNPSPEVLGEIEQQTNTYAEVFDLILDIKAIYEDLYSIGEIRKCDSQNSLCSKNESVVSANTAAFRSALPRLDLPKFDGNKSGFMNFYDLFTQMIVNRDEISPIEKFQYLKLSLKGEPLDLIKHLPVTSDNFDEAWNLIKEDYYKPRMLKSIHFKNIVDLEKLSSASMPGLKNILNLIRENMAALKSLDVVFEDDTAGTALLEYILADKLDPSSRLRWEAIVNSGKEPTLSEFLSFLKDRVSNWESANGSADSKSVVKAGSLKKSWDKANANNNKYSKAVALVTSAELCPLCKASHKLYRCDDFKKKKPAERLQFVKEQRYCFSCLQKGHGVNKCTVKYTCRNCGKFHNTLLHLSSNVNTVETSSRIATPAGSDQTTAPASQGTSVTLANYPSESDNKLKSYSTTMLPTALVDAQGQTTQPHTVRALFDTGSQCSYITLDCAKRLKLPIHHANMGVLSIGDRSVNIVKGRVTCEISPHGLGRPWRKVEMFVVDTITSNIPSVAIDTRHCKHIMRLHLADPYFAVPGPIDILLAADVLANSLIDGHVHGRLGRPTALNTIFGYVVLGPIPSYLQRPTTSTSMRLSLDVDINDMVTKFWELESVPTYVKTPPSEDLKAEEIYVNSVKRNTQGRYCVALPFKEFPPPLGESFHTAKVCLGSLWARLNKNPELKRQYQEFLNDYEQQGHMTEVPHNYDNEETNKSYYIPHHGVLKPDSTTTALRVVFNASKETSNGIALNDTLFVGPPLQRNLFALLLNIRFPRILITADIRQMYRQIEVAAEHRAYQMILWRSNDGVLRSYQLNTVTYGLNYGYLAIRTIEQLAQDEKERFPLAAKVLMSDVYMDDVLTGADDLQTAEKIRNELLNIFEAGCFELRKWASNDSSLLLDLPTDMRRISDLDFAQDCQVKLLGIQWSSATDDFVYTFNLEKHECTKRNILSCVAKIFDPLGLVAPIVMTLKCLIQRLWLCKVGWDECPPQELVKEWLEFQDNLSQLSKVRVPRFVGTKQNLDLIGFCDASNKGFCAVIYARTSTAEVHLLCAKTKVAPLKTISIARLELCACVLLAQLLEAVIKVGELEINSVTGFTDSMVALAWLSQSPHNWKTFIANRVAIVQEILPTSNWAHVPTNYNAADPGSRGMLPTEFVTCDLWFLGPEWLRNSKDTWPINRSVNVTDSVANLISSEEKSKCLLIKPNDKFVLFERCSSWNKLLRSTAYVLRFINNCRKSKSNELLEKGCLTISELRRAQTKIVLLLQREAFVEEIALIQQNKSCRKAIQSLSPFLDSEGVLRVGGRLRHSMLNVSQKFPILLPCKHNVTHMFVRYMHQTFMHLPPQALRSLISHKFWILSARRTIRSVLSKCVTCFKRNPIPCQPVMADLPASRVVPAKPFSKVGVDYGGPFAITLSRRRGQSTGKVYLCLFVCMVTKAVHLELATDLSANKFLEAFRRLIARRGKVTDVFSDCGTNFVGANRYLGDLAKFVVSDNYNQQMTEQLGGKGITWHFNPPSAPHMGGLWEAGIKSSKKFLGQFLNGKILTYDEFYTLLTEIEAILNSRPLYSMSEDPNDLQPLTPGHFLVTEPLIGCPEETVLEVPDNRLSHYQTILKIKQQFWKCWSKDYLNTLQQRNKWHSAGVLLQSNDLVVINDSPLPPSQWRMGRVLEVYPGPDGVARIARVRTALGEVKRPLVKLCPLPSN